MLSLASALEFDNVKSYDENLRLVTITNSFGMGDVIGQARLNTPQNVRVGLGYQKVAEFDLWAYEDYNDALKQFEFKDMKNGKVKINRDYDLKIKKYESVTVQDYIIEDEGEIYSTVENGTHQEIREVWKKVSPADLKKNEIVTIGVFTNVEKGDYVDWIPKIYGVEVDEWATWTEDLNTNLEAYYNLDEASGPVLDVTGNGYDGEVISGTTQGATGKINDAYDFERDNSNWVNLSISPDSVDFTVCAWVNLETSASTAQSIFNYDPPTGTSGGYKVLLLGSGNIRFGLGGSVGTQSYAGTGEWKHLCMIRDQTGSNTGQLFIDGSNVKNTTLGTTVSNGPHTARLGTTRVNSDYYDGLIDEVGIWSRALTPAEVLDLYNGGEGITYPTGTAPQISLTSPANNSNLTSGNVDFIGEVTDDQYVENVTLILDGVVNETQTTHVNGTYTFSKTIAEGVHNWSLLAFDNQSLSNQSDTWFLNYTQPPVFVELISPDASITSTNFTINVTCRGYFDTGVTQLNLTINDVVNQTITNSTPSQNLTISELIDFVDGDYNWSCATTDGMSTAESLTRTFTVNTTPFIGFISPTEANASLKAQSWIDAKVNLTETYFDNLTFYLYNDSGQLNSTTFTNSNREINWTSLISGTYYYNATGWTNNSKSNSTETRTISLDVGAPVITLTSPNETFEVLSNEDSLDLNWTVTDSSLDSCWYGYGGYLIEFEDNGTLPAGVLNHSYERGGLSLTNSTYSFELSNLISPNTGYLNVKTSTGNSLPLTLNSENLVNLTSCDDNTIFLNVSCLEGGFGGYSCYNQFYCSGNLLLNLTTEKNFDNTGPYVTVIESYLGNPENTTVNCSNNYTNFYYAPGINNLTFYANDTYGNLGTELVSWIPKVTLNSIVYNNETLSGYLEDYYLNLTIDDAYDISSATLVYNGEEVSTAIQSNNGFRFLNVTDFAVPSVTSDTNFTFYFNIVLTDGTIINTDNQTQLVKALLLDNCSTYTNPLFNISLFKERSKDTLYGDIELNYQLLNYPDYDVIGSTNLSFTNITEVSLCSQLNLSGDDTYNNIEIRYTSDGYASELYHIQRAPITASVSDIRLYDLNSSYSTEFKVIYQDSSFNFVDGAVIQLQRKYISEDTYETVEAPLTSDEGTAIVHVDLNTVKYRATVVKNGIILDQFENIVFDCANELAGECDKKLLGNIDPQNSEDLDTRRDFHYDNPTLNETTNKVQVSFTVPSGLPSSVNIVLDQKDEFGNTTLCNKTLTSSAGSFFCNFTDALGRSYIDFSIYKDGKPIAKKTYVIKSDSGLDWLDNNFIFMFILLLSLVGMALTSPEWIIVNGIITIVLSGALYLANGLDFVTGLGSIAWLIIAAIILIFKISKQEDR